MFYDTTDLVTFVVAIVLSIVLLAGWAIDRIRK